MSTAAVTRREVISAAAMAAGIARTATAAPLAPQQLAFVLDEQYPGDPGQKSGVAITVDDFGPDCMVSATILAPSQHSLGMLPGRAVFENIVSAHDARMHANVSLCELYPELSPVRPSGAELHYHSCDGSLSVMMGTHCFGVLHGQALADFVSCIRIRCAYGDTGMTPEAAFARGMKALSQI